MTPPKIVVTKKNLFTAYFLFLALTAILIVIFPTPVGIIVTPLFVWIVIHFYTVTISLEEKYIFNSNILFGQILNRYSYKMKIDDIQKVTLGKQVYIKSRKGPALEDVFIITDKNGDEVILLWFLYDKEVVMQFFDYLSKQNSSINFDQKAKEMIEKHHRLSFLA